MKTPERRLLYVFITNNVKFLGHENVFLQKWFFPLDIMPKNSRK